MNEYRTEASRAIKEARWTFLKAFPLLVIVLVLLSVIGFTLNSFGLIGSTIVEREVYKQSFQYKEGMAQRAAILQASISEIDILMSSNPENRQDLINQKLILSAQLKAITINK